MDTDNQPSETSHASPTHRERLANMLRDLGDADVTERVAKCMDATLNDARGFAIARNSPMIRAAITGARAGKLDPLVWLVDNLDAARPFAEVDPVTVHAPLPPHVAETVMHTAGALAPVLMPSPLCAALADGRYVALTTDLESIHGVTDALHRAVIARARDLVTCREPGFATLEYNAATAHLGRVRRDLCDLHLAYTLLSDAEFAARRDADAEAAKFMAELRSPDATEGS